MPRLEAVSVINRSGFAVRSEKLIPPLRQGYYEKIEDQSMGGKAPKDFVRVYEYGAARKSNPGNWPAYIAKAAEKWYPNESITEHLLTRIGECFGLNMAASRLMRADRQIRFLSRYFLSSDESLVHGAEVFAGYLEDRQFVREVEEKEQTREVFTFQFVSRAIKDRFPSEQEVILDDFVRLLAYDAIVGNNDRHYYNWGIVVHARGHRKPRFSPIYDSARALFWNHSEKKIAARTSSPSKREKYIRKYVRGSRPKTGWNGTKSLNHFGLISLLANSNPRYEHVLMDLHRPEALKEVQHVLDTEFAHLMSALRRELLFDCLSKRLESYRDAIS